MTEDPNRGDDPENRSAADADTTSDVTGEGRRGERGAGTSPGAGADATGPTLADAEGKTVVDHEGNTVGLVDEVEGETLYVEPDPGLTDRISASLGWGDRDDDRTIDVDLVDEVTDDSVVLEHTGDVDTDDDPAADTDVSGTSGTSGR
ncbi:hypothetical protein [Halalkalicoccus ordinarius]|uniref:hypothetical protein n=1 Tax=Halalkalicoccus ordinarius TaxID=3116651 RepID=UPI00300F2F6E